MSIRKEEQEISVHMTLLSLIKLTLCLFDEKENQTLLASTYTGFSELRDPLRIIWQTIITHNIVK